MNAPAEIDPLDARLLDLVQQGIPFEPRPFAELGRRAGIAEDDCIARLTQLRDQRRVIRQISAIFDTKALGYASSLVAARYPEEPPDRPPERPPERLDSAAAIISSHPGVSHNYRRNHAFNLWYTLAVPPDSRLGLQGTLDRLHEMSGALSTRALPTLKLYKIGVKLSMSDDEAPSSHAPPASAFTESDRAIASEFTLTAADKRMIVVLQQNLELIPEPFDPWAAQAGCRVDELLGACRRFESRRQMRRFAAVLRHREAGFKANVMGVWQVDEPEADRVGAIMAKSPAVSHCYQRPAYPDWPYRVYTMVHGQSREQCVSVLDDLGRLTGCPYLALWSLHEYKKTRVQYFTPETHAWEAQHAPAAP